MNLEMKELPLSKFSIENKYFIKWGPQLNYNKLPNFNRLNVTEKKVIENLRILKYCTREQLAMQLKNNIRKGKQVVKILKNNGFVQEHSAFNKDGEVAFTFYSLSSILLKELEPNQSYREKVPKVLKHLLASQFFVHFKRSSDLVKINTAADPFFIEITYADNSFNVAVIRDRLDCNKLYSHIKYEVDEIGLTFILADDLGYVSSFLSLDEKKTVKLRFTCDPNIMSDDLSGGFFQIKNKEWYPSRNSIFKNIRYGVDAQPAPLVEK